MLLKLWPILLVLFVDSCASGPKVTVCILDPAVSALECYNEQTGQASSIPVSASDKFVCFNPTDADSLLNYCASK